jgi:UTP-glucose-1-phosphate uridylyltransferase
LVKTAIIPCGGKGTRKGPGSQVCYKHLTEFPSDDITKEEYFIPAVRIGIEALIKLGFTKIIIVINPQDRDTPTMFRSYSQHIMDLFAQGKDQLAKAYSRLDNVSSYVSFRYQSEALGNGNALYEALKKEYSEDKLEDEYLIYFPDNMLEDYTNIKQVMDMYEDSGISVIGSMSVSKTEAHNYGIFDFNDNKFITSLFEKPSTNSDLPNNGQNIYYEAANGIYLFNVDFIKFHCHMQSIHNYKLQKEFGIADSIARWLNQRKPLMSVNTGKVYDIGNPEGIREYMSYRMKISEPAVHHIQVGFPAEIF